MARHLLTLLGVTRYTKTKYQYNGQSYESRFVLEGLMNLVLKDWHKEKGDKVTIFLTEDAKTKNWENWSDNQEQDKDTWCLEKLMKVEYGDIIAVNTVDIENGNTEDEIWQIFYQITNAIEEGDELYIDISNSFRALPVIMTAVAVFARVVKKATVKAIYYGAFVDKDSPTTILDISNFINIIDWSIAGEQFVKKGNVDLVSDLCDKAVENAKINLDLNNMMSMLQHMIAGLDSAQGVAQKGDNSTRGISVADAYTRYKESKAAYDQYCQDAIALRDYSNEPIKQIAGLIHSDMKIFDGISREGINPNLEFGMAAIQWYINKDMAQQGYTALDETMKTYICVKYGMDELEHTNREFGCQDVCKSILSAIDNDEEQYDLEKRQKALEAWKKTNPKPESDRAKKHFASYPPKAYEEYIRLYDKIDIIINEIPREFAKLKMQVSDDRNKFNHFGYANKNDEIVDTSTLIKWCEDFNSVRKLMDEKSEK